MTDLGNEYNNNYQSSSTDNQQKEYPQQGNAQNGYSYNGNSQNSNQQNGNPQNGYPQNGYPQNGYPQYNGFPPYGYPPYVYAPRPAMPTPASEGEKQAYFSTAGGPWMLVSGILFTLNLITYFIANLFLGIVESVLMLIMAIGFWITYANGKKQELSTTGLNLIRVPYIIQFVLSAIGFVVSLILWIIFYNILSLLLDITNFVLQCICFAAIMETLGMGLKINQNKSVTDKKAGKFAGIIIIITALITFLSAIIEYMFARVIAAQIVQSLMELTDLMDSYVYVQLLLSIFDTATMFSVIQSFVTLITSIGIAIVLLSFNNKIKKMNEYASRY